MAISEQSKIEEYYKALIARDSQYLGIFFVGVKTTNVFCKPTCRARKPKKENVLFYSTAFEAQEFGFRPCKVCKPTEEIPEPPDEISDLLSLVSENSTQRIKDSDLHQMGYNAEKVRRWFKTNMGTTFQAYQRMARINVGYRNLKKGGPVTTSAFQSGYDSLSGFNYTFKNHFGKAPKNADELNVLYLHRFSTKLGPMWAGATSDGVCLLEFADRSILQQEINDLTRITHAKTIPGKNEHLVTLEKQIKEYLDKKRSDFDVPLITPGTDFQQLVWNQLQTVPFGTTCTYKELANAVHKPTAIRAVGHANGQNRISIIIPCHRVLGSNGKLTGYGGGLPRKRWLLEHEL